MKRNNRSRKELQDAVQYLKNENELLKMLLKQQHEEIQSLTQIANVQTKNINDMHSLLKKVHSTVLNNHFTWTRSWPPNYKL